MTTHSLRAAPETVRIGVFDAEFPAGHDHRIRRHGGGAVRLRPRGGDAAAGIATGRAAGTRRHPGRQSRHPAPAISSPARSPSPAPCRATCWRSGSTKIEPGANWGYNVIRPLAGTLPEDFHETTLMHIPVDRRRWSAPCPGAPNSPWRRSSASWAWRRRRRSAASPRRSRACMAATSTTRR